MIRKFCWLLLLAAGASQAQGTTPPPAAMDASKFTEERNAASTFVGTMGFFISRMAARCGPLLEQEPAWPRQLAAGWQSANGRLYRAAIGYQSDLLAMVESGGDAAALSGLKEEIRNAVQGGGQRMVDEQLSGDGEHKLSMCRKFAGNLQAGALDLKPGTPHYATLLQLAAERGESR